MAEGVFSRQKIASTSVSDFEKCSVVASVGASVKKGDPVVILEAMKMENEIMAPRAGKIVSVNVEKGAAVESGAVLCVIE